MSKYLVVIFDLDRTLWDFEKNSQLMITELFHRYELADKGIPSVFDFLEVYKKVNDKLWEQLNVGKISKADLRDRRFYESMLQFGLNSRAIAKKMGGDYIKECPSMGYLVEGALEVVQYLSPKYKLAILSNGFKETQSVKMKTTGLKPFFDLVLTSEDVEVHKPHPRGYEWVCKEFGISPSQAIMIGDHYKTDIAGAAAVGMDQIYFNPLGVKTKETTYQIEKLVEIKNIL